MISVTTIASGSTGNCYLVDDGETPLLLECGIPWKRIRKVLGFNTYGIDGVLVTHSHLDHSFAANNVMKAGIDVYTSKGTAEIRRLPGHRLHIVESMKQFNIGTWSIKPFDIEHDAPEPLGFLLANKAGEKLLFLTDTAYCKYRFSGITHLIIECNFDDKILEENILSGVVDPVRTYRLVRSHMSLSRVKDFIRENDTSNLQHIWLCHLSDKNSDAEKFKTDIQRITGVSVVVC